MIRLTDAGVTRNRDAVFFHQGSQTFDVHGISLDDDKAILRHS
jgi:hypothetical protein